MKIIAGKVTDIDFFSRKSTLPTCPIAKHIINLVNGKLKVKYIRKLVKKSYTPVVPIANTCSIGYPHDSRADNAAYRHDRRADNAAYRHDRRADSLSLCIISLTYCNMLLIIFLKPDR